MITITCGAERYWQEWGSWTGYSVTCGAGQMTRALLCLAETEIAACEGGPGMYGEWKNWSVCLFNDWQSLKSELVAQINGLTGHFGQNAVQPVPELL